jgi:hypothetical protein
MYLGIILLGIFNGLAVLPIALYWLGPKSTKSNESLISKDSSSIFLAKP